jgi:hypothetical protein
VVVGVGVAVGIAVTADRELFQAAVPGDDMALGSGALAGAERV